MGLAEDKFEIMEVLVHYAHLIDSKRMGLLAEEIFTEDATIDYGTGLVNGRAAIDEFFRPFAGVLAATTHNMSNFTISVDGATARARSHATAWHWFNETELFGRIRPVEWLALSGYDDELRRTHQGWRISSRRVFNLGSGGAGFGRPPESWLPMFGGLDRPPLG